MAPSLANELGRRGITVNTVAPGAVRTDLTAGGATRIGCHGGWRPGSGTESVWC
ncbi:SDR family oxidoreductase [Streptomyces noursei]|uniref:SDR family oxidoreductase n=1 Tax=Streptomyces noursei TaxID=1971 RepID=UPI0030B8059D